jgi:hypothetical protein
MDRLVCMPDDDTTGRRQAVVPPVGEAGGNGARLHRRTGVTKEF